MSEENNTPEVLPGTIGWNEVVTTDKAATIAFYTELFGWTTEEMPMPDGNSYVIFNNNGKPAAGCVQAPAEAAAQPCWMQYINSEDIDASVAKAISLGASVMVPRTDLPMGSFAVIADPVGAVFSFWQNNPNEDC
ncbi:MAG: VOC family protein [Verrucomicrobiota bacterium]